MEIRPVEIEIAFTRASSTASSGVSIGMKSAKDLSNEDISAIMPLVGTVGKMIYIPNIAEDIPAYKIDKTVNEKSPSQRLYNVIYRLHEQNGGTKEDFRKYYEKVIEGLIDQIKERLG